MIDPEQYLRNWNTYLAGEATTKISVRPDTIDIEKYGHHVSYTNGDGIRHWRFEDKKGYFRFIADYWDELVTQCA